MVKTIRELNAYLRQRISTDADQDIVCVMDTKLAREVANLYADPQQAMGSVASGSYPAAIREIYKRTECPLRSELGKCFAERGYCAAVPGRACSVYQAVYDAGRSARERSARIFADEKKKAGDLLKKVYEAQSALYDSDQSCTQTVVSSVLSSVAVYLDEHVGETKKNE